MLYGALIHGVKGILAYTFYDGGGIFSENNPAQWNEMKQLKQEVNILKPVLLNGSLTLANTGANRVHAGIWTYENQIYAIILNTNRSETKQVAIALPEGAIGPALSMFDTNRYGSNMTFQNGFLSGSIAPEEVHIYVLDTTDGRPTPTPTPTPPPPTPTPTSPPNPYDLSGDGQTNAADVLILLQNWRNGSRGDFNSDGKVNSLDFGLLIANWTE